MISELYEFIDRHRRILVLAGAGLSTASGIPDYRDERGAWKHRKPMDYRDFVSRHEARQRYWARSCIGWPRFAGARPNRAHLALAEMERGGRLAITLTQNVDALERRAGCKRVVELHGSLERVVCLSCRSKSPRTTLQKRLLDLNPGLARLQAQAAPDGDARLESFDFEAVLVPQCLDCGGVLKPDVVFFGESVPRERVDACFAGLDDAGAMLVLGSSLMVYSGFRFVREAARRGIPIAAVNLGLTRADELFELKLEADCASVLTAVLEGRDGVGARDAV